MIRHAVFFSGMLTGLILGAVALQLSAAQPPWSTQPSDVRGGTPAALDTVVAPQELYPPPLFPKETVRPDTPPLLLQAFNASTEEEMRHALIQLVHWQQARFAIEKQVDAMLTEIRQDLYPKGSE